MKENVLTSFIRDTYKTTSLIPYVITGQIIIFILLHIFDLLNFSETTSVDLYSLLFNKSILPFSFSQFVLQPWSLVTHPFIYNSLWNLLFDCLWMYWTGNLFLTFLGNRHYNTLFFGGILIGSIVYLGLGFIPSLGGTSSNWHTTAFGIATVISALMLLAPNMELRLFLFGNIKFKWIAAVYLGLEFAFKVSTNSAAALCYLIVVTAAMIYIQQLQKGNDWSSIFQKNKRKLKIVQNNYSHTTRKHDPEYPNQQQIDQILDKISLKGYEGLTSQEKELLFRASKKQD